MTKRTAPFPPEVCEPAVRMVRDHESEDGAPGSAIQSIAAKIGCAGGTLRNWVRLAMLLAHPPGAIPTVV